MEKIYTYYSPFGLLSIRQYTDLPGWGLTLDNNNFTDDAGNAISWPSPDEAADAVLNQKTGIHLWDQLIPTVVHPRNLDDWACLNAGTSLAG